MKDKELEKKIDKEGDFLFWEDGDYRCLVRRNGHHRQLNGYVGIPKNHTYYGKDYDDIEIDVHGGITYADKEMPGYKGGDFWWFGFDTAHSGDIIPGWDDFSLNQDGTYKDMEYVTKEVESLLKQLKSANEGRKE